MKSSLSTVSRKQERPGNRAGAAIAALFFWRASYRRSVIILLSANRGACNFAAADGLQCNNFAGLSPIAADLTWHSGRARILHCRFFPQRVLLYRAINRLPVPCPTRMTFLFNFHFEVLQLISAPRRFVLAFRRINRGGTAVDLALRLNVLAVAAVFVFVGAVLLGAF